MGGRQQTILQRNTCDPTHDAKGGVIVMHIKYAINILHDPYMDNILKLATNRAMRYCKEGHCRAPSKRKMLRRSRQSLWMVVAVVVVVVE